MTEPCATYQQRSAIVADISASALDYWEATRAAALRAAELLETSGEVAIFLLGCVEPISKERLAVAAPVCPDGRAQPLGLLGPTMRAAVAHEPLQILVVVGSGPVFDLEDWTLNPAVDRTVLVCTGGVSLWPVNGASRRPEELRSDQVDKLLDAVGRAAMAPAPALPERAYQRARQRWELDPTGFPLVWVEPARCFVQLFPITKHQFELFLAASGHAFDDSWYAGLLGENPRASLRNLQPDDCERLFITSVTPDEAATFATWLGPSYSALDPREWRACAEWLRQQPVETPVELFDRMAPEACALWDQLNRVLAPVSLGDLALLPEGLLEWVVERSKPPVPMFLGRPRQLFSRRFWMQSADPYKARPPAQPRLYERGFRLRAAL